MKLIEEMKEMEIQWLGHAGFKVKAENKVIYFDPYQINPNEPADIIVCTHEHSDHTSPKDLKKISTESTVIIGSLQCENVLKGMKFKKSSFLKPGEEISIEGVKFKAVHAYNINKFKKPGVPYHPKEDNKIGMIVEIADKRIYHAGDTDFIPEMKQIKDIDYAFIPVSGTYVMTAEEAIEAIKALQPKIVIPMHIGAIVGSKSDAEKVKSGLTGEQAIEVRIMSKT
ncbi:MAG: MBL fold metallo-hydrolase [Candidatus Hodarchaeales archaeon]